MIKVKNKKGKTGTAVISRNLNVKSSDFFLLFELREIIKKVDRENQGMDTLIYLTAALIDMGFTVTLPLVADTTPPGAVD